MENEASYPDYVQTAYTQFSDQHPIITNDLLTPTDQTLAFWNPYPGPDVNWELTADTVTTITIYGANKRIPFNKKGVIMTGLSPQSTFTINFNSIIERFVTPDQKDLVVLAKPSAEEDYIATAIYSEVVRNMPVAVHSEANGLGDWFMDIVDGIANTIGGITKPISAAVDAYTNVRGNPPAKFMLNAAPKAIRALEGTDKKATVKPKQNVQKNKKLQLEAAMKK